MWGYFQISINICSVNQPSILILCDCHLFKFYIPILNASGLVPGPHLLIFTCPQESKDKTAQLKESKTRLFCQPLAPNWLARATSHRRQPCPGSQAILYRERMRRFQILLIFKMIDCCLGYLLTALSCSFHIG